MRISIKIASLLVIFMFGLSAFANDRGLNRTPGRNQAAARGTDSGVRGRARAEERIRDIERRREQLSEQFKEERERARDLVLRHRRALTEAERTALESELKELLEEGFERRHAALKERIEHLKEEYERIESKIKENLGNKDEIIESRIERLLQMPERRGEPGKYRNRGIAQEGEKR